MAYPTATELREAFSVLDKSPAISDTLLDDLVAEFKDAVEHDHGIAYAPTEVTETYPGTCSTVLELRHRLVSDVDSVTVDGVTQSLADVIVRSERGAIERPGGWFGKEIAVIYTHGMDTPAAVSRACREFVRARATKSASNQPREAAGPAGVDGTSYPVASSKPTGVRTADLILAGMRSYRLSGVVG